MVHYSQSLIQKLEESLRSAFNQPLLRLTRPARSGSEIRVTLADGQKIVPMEEASVQLVVEILTGDQRRSSFWFGFVAVFGLAEIKKYTLQHSSLMVFHDIGGELVPLFRAEWDQLDASNEESKHAQPHWHFVQNPERIEGLIRSLSRPSPAVTNEFSPEQDSKLFSGLADCGQFHFAMTSLWEKSETPPYKKRLFDSDDFPKWFKNLTNYVAGQIDYLVSHMPAAAAQTTRVFVPTEAQS